MKKFEIGMVYCNNGIGRNSREYIVISRTDKSIVFENPKYPGNELYQMRKSIKFHSDGSEYVEIEKGSASTYRNHRNSVGRYMLKSGKNAVTIQA